MYDVDLMNLGRNSKERWAPENTVLHRHFPYNR